MAGLKRGKTPQGSLQNHNRKLLFMLQNPRFSETAQQWALENYQEQTFGPIARLTDASLFLGKRKARSSPGFSLI